MNVYKVYYIEKFNCTVFDEIKLRNELNDITLEKISLGGTVVFPDKHIVMCDEENPLVLANNFFFKNVLCIDKTYFEKHTKEMIDLVVYICKNTANEYISIEDTEFITDEVIDAILNNTNLREISLGSSESIFVLTEKLYEKFKNSHIKSVRTYAVDESLKENFDPLIGYNFNRNLIGFDNYESLLSKKSIILYNSLTEEELYNLKYLNKDVSVSLKSENYENTFKAIDRLRDCGHVGKITITIDDKNLLNNYIFRNIDKIKNLDNVEVYLSGTIHSLSTYMKYEKKLVELILPAMNLSPFEKYLYAYNVTKKFKKYKENEDDKTSARDLYQIMDNEYMVCVGYSKLLGDLLSKLGIESYDESVTVDIGLDNIPNEEKPLPDFIYDEKTGELKELKTEGAGHARRKIHLVDPKYGIDGYYFSDPTWDNDLEYDAYNHALMTGEEYIGLKRYNYYSRHGIGELFFVHSLEEFYLKINIYLDKNPNQKEKDVIRSLLYVFKKLDFELYSFIYNKYEDVDRLGKDFTKEEIQKILLDIGERIVSKSNNLITGNLFKEGITVLYRDVDGLSGEELDKKINETMEFNKKRQAKCFPTRYKVDRNNNSMVILNLINKFDLDEEPKLGI